MEKRKEEGNNSVRIDALQNKINEKFKDNCFDDQFVLDITSDIQAGITLEQIQDVLDNTEDCSEFRRKLEGLRYISD